MTQAATQVSHRRPSAALAAPVEELRALSLRALKRLYRRDRGLFAFRLKRQREAVVLEGVSPRYTAIALIGLAAESEGIAAEVFSGESTGEVWRRLAEEVRCAGNLGDIALTLWAGRLLGEDGERIVGLRDRLCELGPAEGVHPTVEAAWSLTALAADQNFHGENAQSAREIADRLTTSFVPESGMFRHVPAGTRRWNLRSHVCCFADLVYPTLALARYFRLTGEREALDMARQCAERICRLQGPAGQWWWHYDVRTGRVVEGYPVYSVHQDGMAPMALFELQDACGDDYNAEAERGLLWLLNPPETGRSLVDTAEGLIWRKVARREPAKLSRTVQALASRLHPALRVPGHRFLFPPVSVDYECRPYHLGWLLYAWGNRRSGR